MSTAASSANGVAALRILPRNPAADGDSSYLRQVHTPAVARVGAGAEPAPVGVAPLIDSSAATSSAKWPSAMEVDQEGPVTSSQVSGAATLPEVTRATGARKGDSLQHLTATAVTQATTTTTRGHTSISHASSTLYGAVGTTNHTSPGQPAARREGGSPKPQAAGSTGPSSQPFDLPAPHPCTINGWPALVHFQQYSSEIPQQVLVTRQAAGAGGQGAGSMPTEDNRQLYPFRLLMHPADRSRLSVLRVEAAQRRAEEDREAQARAGQGHGTSTTARLTRTGTGRSNEDHVRRRNATSTSARLGPADHTMLVSTNSSNGSSAPVVPPLRTSSQAYGGTAQLAGQQVVQPSSTTPVAFLRGIGSGIGSMLSTAYGAIGGAVGREAQQGPPQGHGQNQGAAYAPNKHQGQEQGSGNSAHGNNNGSARWGGMDDGEDSVNGDESGRITTPRDMYGVCPMTGQQQHHTRAREPGQDGCDR